MIVTFLCRPDRKEGMAVHIGVNPRYVNLVEEDEHGHALIVFERRTITCYDGRGKIIDALNDAERGTLHD